jgi:ribosomal-protein-alanine N-acetyltransferase
MNDISFTELETERLVLKPIAPAFREFVFRQFSDADVNRYLYDEEPFTDISDADGLIGFYLSPPADKNRWILCLKDGTPIGTCGFHCADYVSGTAEMGYDMQKAYWGKGYMAEAARAALLFARDKMHIKTVYLHIYPENAGSVRLAERLGFKRTNETITLTFRGKDYLHSIYALALGGSL